MSGSQPNPYGTFPQDSQSPNFAPQDSAKPKKKKRGFLKCGVGIVAVVVLFSAFTNNDDDDDAATTADCAETNKSVDLVSEAEAETEPDAAAGADANADTAAETSNSDAAGVDDNVSKEFQNALRSAERYLDFSSFSYQGLYDQLTSEYADAYPADAAQYAVDTVTVDWNEEALESAENYLEFSHFSYQGLYDQLTSE